MRRLGLLTLCVGVSIFCNAHAALAALDVRTTSIGDVPVWFAEDYAVPVVHVTLTFEGAGTASDAQALAGRATLNAAMMGEGAGALDALAFNRALESRAISFRVSAGRDDVVVSIHALKEQLPEAMRLARLALSKPRYDTQSLEQMRQEQLSTLRRSLSNPSAMAARTWREKMYANHPYGRDMNGTQQSVEAMSAEDLEAYRERYITAANLSVAAAGAMSKSELKDAIAPLIEALPQAFFPERDLPGANLDGGGEVVRLSHASPQSVVLFGGKGIARADKQFYAAYLMNEALGSGSLTSRLMMSVRRKHGLVYSVGTQLQTGDGADAMVGQFSTRNATVDKAIAAVKATVKVLADSGLGANECKDLKHEIIAQFALKLDSTQSIAETIAMMMRHDLGEDYLEKREEYFDAVSCQDIQTQAQKLLNSEQWLWVMVGGEPSASEPDMDTRSDAPKSERNALPTR